MALSVNSNVEIDSKIDKVHAAWKDNGSSNQMLLPLFKILKVWDVDDAGDAESNFSKRLVG